MGMKEEQVEQVAGLVTSMAEEFGEFVRQFTDGDKSLFGERPRVFATDAGMSKWIQVLHETEARGVLISVMPLSDEAAR